MSNKQAEYYRIRDARRDRVPSIIPPFQPNQLPNLVLWLDASKITKYSDGQSVEVWPDYSPLHNDAVQHTGTLQPIYKRNVINGMPAVRFDGTDDYFETLNNMPGGSGSVHIFAVLKATTQNQVSIMGWGTETTKNYMSFKIDTGKTYLSWFNSTLTPLVATITSNVWYYVAAVSSLTIDEDFYREVRTNGSEQYDNFNPTVVGKNTTATTGKIGLSEVANNTWHGDIAEVCVYQGFMPLGAYDPSPYWTTELYEHNIHRLESYFKLKYGL